MNEIYLDVTLRNADLPTQCSEAGPPIQDDGLEKAIFNRGGDGMGLYLAFYNQAILPWETTSNFIFSSGVFSCHNCFLISKILLHSQQLYY